MEEPVTPAGMTFDQAEQIISLLTNLTSGAQILLIIAGGWFVWMVIKIFYNLLNGVFLGGL